MDIKDLEKNLSGQINEKLDNVSKQFEAFKETNENNLKNRDVILEEKLSKISDDLTKNLEDAQKLQVRLDQFEKSEKQLDLEGKRLEKEHKQKFDKFLREGISSAKEEIEIRSMNTQSDPDGGYFVRPNFANFSVGRFFETSPMRQLARVERISQGNSLTIDIDDNEAAAEWTGERSAASNTDTPNIGSLEIFAHKIDAEPRITVEMLQDPDRDIEAWLQEKVADKMTRTQNTAFVSGNGSKKPRGFLSLDAWTNNGEYEREKLEYINSGTSSTIVADKLIETQAALKEPYQPNANWLMKRQTFGEALKLKASTTGDYLFSPVFLRTAEGSAQVNGPVLLGKPVVFADDMPGVGANSKSIAYGDFSVGYTIVDHVSMTILRDPYTDKARVKYYVLARVGGDVTNYEAIKINRLAN